MRAPESAPFNMASAAVGLSKAGDLSNGVRSSPRKRKQEPEQSPVETLTTPSPAKKAKNQSTKSPRMRETLAATPELEEDPTVVTPATTEATRSKKDGNSNNTRTGEVNQEDEDAEEIAPPIKTETGTPSKTKQKPRTKRKSESETDNEIKTANGEVVNGDGTVKKPARKRKTKEEKEAEAMPLAARTTGAAVYVGAHVSIAKGIENAVTNCVHVGGNAFALFLQSQRKWENKPLAEENKIAFIHACREHKYEPREHVMPHGSYLVNLAQLEKDKAKQAYDFFIGDLKRCEALGITLYNFHPGASGKGNPTAEAIQRLAKQLNRALSETSTVIPVLENMAGSGSVIGSRFEDLRDIIALIEPEHKSRIGVCIDTCHAFAAGYDLRSPEAFKRTMQEFDDIVGVKYLKGLHINDSKAPFDSKKDLHQNIGLGFLGLRAFHNVMNETRFQDLPLILETPWSRPDPSDPTGKKQIEDQENWAREIKLLEILVGMDPEGDEFKRLETDLSERGRAEREKMQSSIENRNAKAKRKLEKGQRTLGDMFGKKGKKNVESEDISELSEEEEDG